MSCLPNIFRKKKKNGLTVPQTKAMKTLKDTTRQDLLVKHQESLEKQIEMYTRRARRNAKINRLVAYRALQQKKRLEKKLRQIDNILTTHELQQVTLNSATNNIIRRVRSNNGTNSQNVSDIKTNQQKKLISDIISQNCMVNDISNAIRNSFVPDMTEEELVEELNKLELEETKQNDKIRKVLKFPEISTEITKETPPTNRTETKTITDFEEISQTDA